MPPAHAQRIRIASCWLGEDGFVRFLFDTDAMVTAADVEECVAFMRKVSPNEPPPGMVADIRCAAGATREARVFGASLGPDVVRGLAVVVGNTLRRYLMRFYLVVNRPAVPTAACETVDEALAWLAALHA